MARRQNDTGFQKDHDEEDPDLRAEFPDFDDDDAPPARGPKGDPPAPRARPAAAKERDDDPGDDDEDMWKRACQEARREAMAATTRLATAERKLKIAQDNVARLEDELHKAKEQILAAKSIQQVRERALDGRRAGAEKTNAKKDALRKRRDKYHADKAKGKGGDGHEEGQEEAGQEGR